MIRITVKTPAGDLATGSGFHVGNGVVATARHVFDRGPIEEVVSEYINQRVKVKRIHFHKDPRVDLAVAVTGLSAYSSTEGDWPRCRCGRSQRGN
jgi:hypothetical protein